MFVCRHGDFCGGNAIKICFRCSLVEIDWNSFVTFFMDFYIENKREELGCLMDVSSQQLLGTWTTCSSKKIQFFSSNFWSKPLFYCKKILRLSVVRFTLNSSHMMHFKCIKRQAREWKIIIFCVALSRLIFISTFHCHRLLRFFSPLKLFCVVEMTKASSGTEVIVYFLWIFSIKKANNFLDYRCAFVVDQIGR